MTPEQEKIVRDLYSKSSKHYVDKVIELIDSGVIIFDFDNKHPETLCLRRMNGSHLRVVEFLLNNGETFAMRNPGGHELIAYLIKNGADIHH